LKFGIIELFYKCVFDKLDGYHILSVWIFLLRPKDTALRDGRQMFLLAIAISMAISMAILWR